MTHPVEGKYVEWPLRAALQDIDERLKRIEAQVAHPLVTVQPKPSENHWAEWAEHERRSFQANAQR